MAPPEADYDEFMATDLPLAVAEGNQAMVNMITSAAMSLFQGVYGAPSALLAFRSADLIAMDPLKNEYILRAVVKELEVSFTQHFRKLFDASL